jgi:glycosyltransferase involved in cell wall biosynthesis
MTSSPDTDLFAAGHAKAEHRTPNTGHGVSAVIPAFNNADTIAEALESVAGQTCPVAEAIVVDDGSGDRTAEIARATIERCGLPGVVLRQENAGPAAARNRGVAAAKSEWIAFLDADDTWFPWRTETQMRLADANSPVLCWCGDAMRMGESDGADKTPGKPVDPLFRRIGVDDLIRNNAVATSTVLLRKRDFDAVGGFDPSFRGPEDFDLWLRLASSSPLAFVDAPLAGYRHRAGSLSRDERRFLPEVLGVLRKTFGPGGVLERSQHLRPMAESTQHWNASWMAFVRGDRSAAIALWRTAWRLNRSGAERVPRPWWRLLARYLVGRMREEG